MFRQLTPLVLLIVGLLLAGCSQDTKSGGAAGTTLNSAVEATQGTASDAMTSVSDAASEAVDAATGAAETAVAEAKEGLSAMADGASQALAGIEGGPEALKQVTDFFASAGDSLKGITDAASAQAALPKLSELPKMIEGLGPTLEKLPAEAKTAILGVIDSGIVQLKDLADKALALPGVETVVKPIIDDVMAKLEALKGTSP
jgi:uncharacterized phage infection (PIP) family protein YhgE